MAPQGQHIPCRGASRPNPLSGMGLRESPAGAPRPNPARVSEMRTAATGPVR
jgi:hypothetical protein